MLTRLASSGDAIADRRYQWAEGLLAEGDATAAAMLLAETAMLVPDWPAVWARLGDAYVADGAPSAAADAYRKAVEVDPDDVLGAGLKLARLRLAAPPAAPPPAHVGALFDTYAPRFDALLVDGLGYAGPRLVADLLTAAAPDRRFAAALDLGCGTGLAAAPLRARCDRLVGVDLSREMLAAAAAKGLYDALVAGEAVAVAAADTDGPLGDERYDLILAADVLCYLGDLAPLFGAVAGRLAPDGLFAITTEAAQPGEAGSDGWLLRDSLRYAHDPEAVAARAGAAGLAVVASEIAVLRHDRGSPIEAGVFVFSRAGAEADAAPPRR